MALAPDDALVARLAEALAPAAGGSSMDPFVRASWLQSPNKRAPRSGEKRRADDAEDATANAACASDAGRADPHGLTADMREALSRLHASLRAPGGGRALGASELELLLRCCAGPDERAAAAIGVLEPSELTDEALHRLTTALADATDWPGAAVSAFSRHVLLPRLCRLDTPASRTLSGAFLALQRQRAAAVVDDLLVPLVTRSDLRQAQAELVGRLAKELPPPAQRRLVVTLLHRPPSAAAPAIVWGEAQMGVLQAVLALRPPLDGAALAAAVDHVDAYAAPMRTSPKFSNLLLTLVGGYGGAMSSAQLALARGAAERLTTIMRKSALTAIARHEGQAAGAAG